MDYWVQLDIKLKPQEVGEDVSSGPTNWLQENHPLLLDVPVEDIDPCRASTDVIVINQLKIKPVKGHYVLDHEEGAIKLNHGDVLSYGDFFIQVNFIYPKQSRQSQTFYEHGDDCMILSGFDSGAADNSEQSDHFSHHQGGLNESILSQRSFSQSQKFIPDMSECLGKGNGNGSFPLVPPRSAPQAKTLQQPAFSLPVYQQELDGQNFDIDFLGNNDLLSRLDTLPSDEEMLEKFNFDGSQGVASDRMLDDIENLYFDQPTKHSTGNGVSFASEDKKTGMLSKIKAILGG